MPIRIPARLIELVLLGPLDDRRQLQDSPILGDVWVAFGEHPGSALDLLISPYLHENAGTLAVAIHDDLREDEDGDVAYVHGLVAARLTFCQLLGYVVPKTKWWTSQWRTVAAPTPGKTKKKAKPKKKRATSHEHPVMKLIGNNSELVKALEETIDSATRGQSLWDESATRRFLALAGLLCWAGQAPDWEGQEQETVEKQISYILGKVDLEEAAQHLRDIAGKIPQDLGEHEGEQKPLVFTICLNRSATPALERSVPAVKADAAHSLFRVDCSKIAWAILDSGIDARHEAFRSKDGQSRIRRSFDFKNFRKIVNMGNLRPKICKDNVTRILDGTVGLLDPPSATQAARDLKQLAEDARRQAPIHWELVERFVRIDPVTPPPSPHGTHVAGILGASKEAAQGEQVNNESCDGMCPDINLYDFRVLGRALKETEFAIIAALQFVRYLNERGSLKVVQGANLSLSIPHDVRNFACGRTPICNACENLVENGVVVVAAAGNHGYKNFQTLDGPFAGYAAFSITDPGNAYSVITVGSTHRYWPHTYGVSFFSSRGPTGDGREKPDLVAPGERIQAPLVGNANAQGTWGDLDGTSMAAPHVSGAAAMLMARYTELKEQPRRIKQILCESATDLGRERTFQGHGMLDVLRAFQSV